MVARSRSLADLVVQLKSLREDPHLRDLMDVHGILEMKKMTNLTSLKPILGQDGTTTYGFKATKRKFKIEVRHHCQKFLLDYVYNIEETFILNNYLKETTPTTSHGG